MTVKDYVELKDRSEINMILRYSQKAKLAIDTLGIGSYEDWKFDHVKQMQMEFDDINFFRGIYWFDVFGVNNIGDIELIKAIQCYNYLIEQIKVTIELESELLGGDNDIDVISAGVSELEELGAYLQVRQIAKELNLRIEEVKKMKYKDAFLELLTQKRINDFQKRLIEVKQRKLNKSF